ncbi:MAG: DUF4136 domain-containing protein [Bacteroidetes bacterium]|nr:DUF4136 domain-containing protein [Bacteroidota bacterium]
MKLIAKIITGIIAVAIAGCNIYTATYSNYDRSVDFTKYKTFAWLPDSGIVTKKDSFTNTPYDNDIIRNNTKNYIIHCLGERGYRVQVDTPDVLVQLVLLNEKKERIVSYNYSPSYYYSYYPNYYNHYYYPYYYPYYDYYTYYGWGLRSSYYGYTSTYKETYVKGTIIINMFDRKLKKLVWTGSAEGDIYDPAYIMEEVHPAVHSIMKSFPIEPLKKPKKGKDKNGVKNGNLLSKNQSK